jgi:hypothetical protein
VVGDLRAIYTAVDADRALHALDAFEAKWGQKFPPFVKTSRDAWEHVIPFLAFPPEVRRVIYTTDESVKGSGFGFEPFLPMDRSRRGARRAADRRRWRRSGVRLRSLGRSCRFWACESVVASRRHLRPGVSWS